jgi:hypothetical protein
MKLFLRKTLLFLILFIAVLHAAAYLLIITKTYQVHVLGNEIYSAIANSKRKSKSKKLIMGDSVAQQLFDNKVTSDSINSIACNQAISIAGQYFLLTNYLKAGNMPDTVIFVSTPFSFQNNLNQIFTFQYFLKPFYKDEYKPLYTATVKKQIEDVPYYWLSQNPLVKTTNWAPEYIEAPEDKSVFLSPIAIEYLQKIKALAKENNFKLFFLPTPTPTSRKSEVDILNKNDYLKNGLQQELEGYLDKVQFIDDDNFIDKIHLKNPDKFVGFFLMNQ